jgi:hypothetical protein
LAVTDDATAINRPVVDYLDLGVERLRQTFGPTWRPIVAPSYRRSLGRAIARL